MPKKNQKQAAAAAEKKPADEPAVPENIKKKLQRDEKLMKAKKTAMVKAKTDRTAARKLALANAEKYAKEYATADQALIDGKRKAKKEGSFFVEGEPKVAFLIRIKGINKLAPKPKKILQLMRLRQLHNGVFVKLNKATLNMIKIIEPHITYGYPSRENISKLIYKRGHGKVNRMRIPLTDNSIVASELGKHGINCVEDLVHEIVTCGPKFKEANNFLWPFKLSSPLGGFEIKRHSFGQGYGAYGNREELINQLIKKMN